MLENLSEEVRECYRHAQDCACKAAAQTDLQLKTDFFNLAQRWLSLARSYEFTDRVSNETKRQVD
jgi:hypothetical protein